MNETMIDNWNKYIKPGHKVYHLGDVMFGNVKDYNSILYRLNGQKRLIVGNHDNVKLPELSNHFKKIEMWNYFKEHNFLVSHVPIFQGEIRKVAYNVHGHTHQHADVSPFHINISVERTDFRPLHLDEILQRIKDKS